MTATAQRAVDALIEQLARNRRLGAGVDRVRAFQQQFADAAPVDLDELERSGSIGPKTADAIRAVRDGWRRGAKRAGR